MRVRDDAGFMKSMDSLLIFNVEYGGGCAMRLYSIGFVNRVTMGIFPATIK